jgi:dsDNA-specific endonuclease/ATPase MutS2
MAFQIGDVVKYLNEKGGGTVIRILDDGRVEIEDEHGFNFIVSNGEIVTEKHSGVDSKQITERLKSFGSNLKIEVSTRQKTGINFHELIRDRLVISKNYWTNKNRDFVEIDLHIDELIEKPGTFSDGEKLNYQLNYARECLDASADLKIAHIVFIHGVGAGVLRHELRSWLKALNYVSFENADYRRYGIGATQVRIHGINQ